MVPDAAMLVSECDGERGSGPEGINDLSFGSGVSIWNLLAFGVEIMFFGLQFRLRGI